jgi:hypothetical protein
VKVAQYEVLGMTGLLSLSPFLLRATADRRTGRDKGPHRTILALKLTRMGSGRRVVARSLSIGHSAERYDSFPWG